MKNKIFLIGSFLITVFVSFIVRELLEHNNLIFSNPVNYIVSIVTGIISGYVGYRVLSYLNRQKE